VIGVPALVRRVVIRPVRVGEGVVQERRHERQLPVVISLKHHPGVQTKTIGRENGEADDEADGCPKRQGVCKKVRCCARS
jgi:hypothetical protein